MVDKKQILYLYHLQGVADLFDDYAETFNTSLQALRYNVPTLLRNQLSATTAHHHHQEGNNKKFKRCLDLGCGTGLSGVAFRDCCDYLEGVDLSQKMIRKAREEGIYDKTAHCDLQGYLKRKCPDASFDLVISVDVLMYVYDLAPLFEELKRVVTHGGTCALSTEALQQTLGAGVEDLDANDDNNNNNKDVMEQESCRYAHSRSHVLRLAVANGFTLTSVENVLGRMDEGKEIRSDLFVFQRTME